MHAYYVRSSILPTRDRFAGRSDVGDPDDRLSGVDVGLSRSLPMARYVALCSTSASAAWSSVSSSSSSDAASSAVLDRSICKCDQSPSPCSHTASSGGMETTGAEPFSGGGILHPSREERYVTIESASPMSEIWISYSEEASSHRA